MHSPTNANNHHTDPKQSLQNHRLFQSILLDLLIFIILIIPIILCEFVIEPFRRGFFCDDETLRYPYKENTITTTVLGVTVILPPIIVLSIGEYARQYNKGQLHQKRDIFGYKIAAWMVNCFKQIVYFCFGGLLILDATELGKYAVGRLRPHFMSVCQPQLADGSTCYDLVNQHRYVENYFCLGTGFTIPDVREARLSFPSGHSSLIFYACVYVSLYLQKRMHWRRSILTRNFIQFSFIMLAWFVALTRVMDNWHHWSDVLAGCLMGILGALITANFISKLFQDSYTEFDSLRLAGLTRRDTSATLNEVLVATPPPYTIQQQQQQQQQTEANAFTNETFSTKV